MVRIPTVKQMVKRGFKKEEAVAIRKRLERYRDKYPFGDKVPTLTLRDVSQIMDGEGMESIRVGKDEDTYEVHYVNMGDTYHETILFYGGSFHVGNWGYLAERDGTPD